MANKSSKSKKTFSELYDEISDNIKKLSKQFEHKERDLIKHQFRSHGISGITPQQFFILRVLWMVEEGDISNKYDGLSLKYMANEAHCTRSTMTGIIDRMEKVGLVVRISNPKDKRSKLIKLTEKGLSLKKYKPPKKEYHSDVSIFRDFCLDDIDLLNQLLKKLSSSMED